MHRLFAAVLILSLLAAGTARAMLAPKYYLEARRDAPFHVQIAVTAITPAKRTHGDCTVEGKVVTIFRDTYKRLKVGTDLRFTVPCYSKAAPPPPDGPKSWVTVERLRSVRFIEAYLEAGWKLALWQWTDIDAPSKTPQFPVDRMGKTK